MNQSNSCTFEHAPGPKGLPGGYPVILDKKGAHIMLPEDLTLEQAMKINERSQVYDGIKNIMSDGTTGFTQICIDVMTEFLNYNCSQLKIDECWERADELGIKTKEYLRNKF